MTTTTERTARARGAVLIHACPPALCAHVEWAIGGVLGRQGSLTWSVQPVDAGMLRAECSWTGQRGTAAAIAGELRGWTMLRYEITEDPSPGCDGERLAYVPGRGLYRGIVAANGDYLLGEQQLRHLMAMAGSKESLVHDIEQALGAAWDADLEVYRHAGDGAPTTLLNRVG